MLRSILVLTALLLPVAPAAAADPDVESGAAQRALNEAREAWTARDLDDYDFRVERSCFCPVSYTRPRDVKVRDGKPVAGGKKIRPYATVPRIFALIQGAIDERADILDVRYGPGGVPRAVYVDYSFMTADEEIGIFTSRFQARR